MGVNETVAAAAKAPPAKALALLLEVWKQCPAASVAAAIATVDKRARGELLPPTGKTGPARHAAWLAAAATGDLVMRGVLVDAIADTKGNAETLERIEALVPYLPDPRISGKLIELVAQPIYNASVSRTAKFWKAMFALLPQLADPRAKQDYVAGWTRNRELNPAEREELAKRLGKIQPALDGAYPKVFALDVSLPASGAKPVDRGAALLAAIYDDPDDDTARSVYADYLQEKGDPRGEFIALQLADAQHERQAELLEEYTARWLGGMQIKRTGLKWERGFVVAGEALDTHGDPDPAWRLVRELTDTAPLRDGFPMPSLRTLTTEHLQPLTLLHEPLTVERLIYTSGVDTRFAKVTCLPALKHLELRGIDDDCSAMLEAKWLALASVHAMGDLSALAGWTKLAIPEVAVEERGAHGWTVRFTRAGKKHDVALVAPRIQPSAAWLKKQHRPWGEAMLAGLAMLPRAAIASVRVETTAAAKSLVHDLFAKQLSRLYGDVAWSTMRA